MLNRCNILLAGCGVAGLTLGYYLARSGLDVCILEREEYSPTNASWLALSPWDPAEAPDDDLARLAWAGAKLRDAIPGALIPRSALHLFARGCGKEAAAMWIRGHRSGTGVRQLEAAEVAEMVPWMKTDPEYCAAALWVPAGGAGMTDVGRLYSHFRTGFQQHGGRILLEEALVEARREGGGWTVRTTKGSLRADVVVNCAGAWSDDVAHRCQVRKVGLHSTKRAALDLAVAGAADLPWRESPFISWHGDSSVAHCNRLQTGRVVVSPAAETTWNGGAIEAEGWQIKAGLEEFEARTDLRLDETNGSSWAWIWASVQDGLPVVGWAPETRGFFWMSGHGRGGAECALATSAIASDMISGRSDFSWLVEQYGIRPSRIAPGRLAGVAVTA